MASILVSGGRKIVGTARVSGAKNAALPILAATLIARGPVELTDCPHLSDVENMLKILRSLGVSCSLEAGTAYIDAAKAERCIMPQSISKEIRSSIFMLGPLLGRFGRAVCTFPGGWDVGRRGIDLRRLPGALRAGGCGVGGVCDVPTGAQCPAERLRGGTLSGHGHVGLLRPAQARRLRAGMPRGGADA